MKEQFSNDFRLNNTTQNNVQSNFKVPDNGLSKDSFEELFDFNVQDKFTENFARSTCEFEYLSLNQFENGTEKTKQIEKEIANIKNLENPSRDYFNF